MRWSTIVLHNCTKLIKFKHIFTRGHMNIHVIFPSIWYNWLIFINICDAWALHHGIIVENTCHCKTRIDIYFQNFHKAQAFRNHTCPCKTRINYKCQFSLLEIIVILGWRWWKWRSWWRWEYDNYIFPSFITLTSALMMMIMVMMMMTTMMTCGESREGMAGIEMNISKLFSSNWGPYLLRKKISKFSIFYPPRVLTSFLNSLNLS